MGQNLHRPLWMKTTHPYFIHSLHWWRGFWFSWQFGILIMCSQKSKKVPVTQKRYPPDSEGCQNGTPILVGVLFWQISSTLFWKMVPLQRVEPVAVSCGYGTCFAVKACDGLCHLTKIMDRVETPFGFQWIVWTFVRHTVNRCLIFPALTEVTRVVWSDK